MSYNYFILLKGTSGRRVHSFVGTAPPRNPSEQLPCRFQKLSGQVHAEAKHTLQAASQSAGI